MNFTFQYDFFLNKKYVKKDLKFSISVQRITLYLNYICITYNKLKIKQNYYIINIYIFNNV